MIKSPIEHIDYILNFLHEKDIDGAVSALKSWKDDELFRKSEAQPVILILDDDADILEMLGEYLIALNFKVLQSSSLHTAQEQIESQRELSETINYAMLDIMLRAEHGHDIVPQLLTAFPNVKIIFASGHASERTLISSETSQVIGWLQKPFPLHALRQLLF